MVRINGDSMVILRGEVLWRTVTVYHGVPHVLLTAVSPIDTNGGHRGWPSLAVVLEVDLCTMFPRWLKPTQPFPYP